MTYDKLNNEHYDIACVLMSQRTEECYDIVFSEIKAKTESLFGQKLGKN